MSISVHQHAQIYKLRNQTFESFAFQKYGAKSLNQTAPMPLRAGLLFGKKKYDSNRFGTGSEIFFGNLKWEGKNRLETGF